MIKRIPLVEARPGDILNFKGSGPLFQVLSRIIKLKVPTWDRYGWHCAPVVRDGLPIITVMRLDPTDYSIPRQSEQKRIV